MIWPFGKKKAPPPERGPINEDCQAGDLAVCISDGSWYPACDGPKKDQTYLVVQVVPGHYQNGHPAWGLGLREYPGFWWEAQSFRKVRPVHKACDADFRERIERARQKVRERT